jgi:hypothetical protein
MSLLAASLLLSASFVTAQEPSFPAISPRAAMSHVQFLASDVMNGRATPSPELTISANYIAAVMEQSGLVPLPGQKSILVEHEHDGQKVFNVVGMLPGSDPVLKDEFVLVGAHYDHIGTKPDGEDRIFNGANDDASGVSGVLEIARGFQRLGKAPRRSVVFVAFWGEERGLLGARAFIQKQTLPSKSIAALINLEQIGRTDDNEGPRKGEFNVTGFELSDLADKLKAAAEPLGVKVTGHPRFSIPFFSRADNFAFAQKGIVAHTISTCYMFPDYHGVDDELERIEPEHLASMIQAIGAGVRAVADGDRPKWKDIPAAKRYRDAAGG